MAKYLDMEAHETIDLEALFGMKRDEKKIDFMELFGLKPKKKKEDKKEAEG